MHLSHLPSASDNLTRQADVITRTLTIEPNSKLQLVVNETESITESEGSSGGEGRGDRNDVTSEEYLELWESIEDDKSREKDVQVQPPLNEYPYR